MREEAEHGVSFKTLANHYLYIARLPGFIRELLQQRQEVHDIRTDEPSNSALDYFAVNVEHTMQIALDRGAAVVLSTPPSALSLRNKPSDPPERTYWIKDAGTTEEYRQRLAARMRRIATAAQSAGQPVTYVLHRLPLEEFLDDAHLTNEGNLTVARQLVSASMSSIRKRYHGPSKSVSSLCL
jgi:hypothetical protein